MPTRRAHPRAVASYIRRRATRIATAAICAALVGTSFVAAESATADPRLGSVRTYAGVGSAATAGLWDGLTNGRPDIENSRVIAPTIASYDTSGSDRIRTRSEGPLFMRPWTNYDGARLLSAANHAPYLFDATRYWEQGLPAVNVSGQVDFSRETRIDPRFPGNDLTYMAFVRDAVSVVGRDLDPDLWNLTSGEVHAIFTCTSIGRVSTIGSGRTAQVWIDDGGGIRQRLYPKIPQGTGDVRDFFTTAAGFSGTYPCVNVDAQYPHEPEENDGRELSRSGDVIPFLASAWIAQKNLEVPTTVATGSLRILSINGSAPAIRINQSLLPGPLYNRSAAVPATGRGIFWRDVYNVIDSSDVGTPLEAALTTAVGTPLARYATNRFGFKNIDYLGDRAAYRTGGYQN